MSFARGGETETTKYSWDQTVNSKL